MPEDTLPPHRAAAPGVSALGEQDRRGEPDVSGGPAVEFQNVDITYGRFVAVKNFSLPIRRGSFVTLLGPSGCGKTTVLRSIAGLVGISGGQISIAGKRVDDVPIYKRNIGLVFQNYALFPHKTVFDNVAFGLKYRNVPKAEIVRKVGRALEMVRLPGAQKKLPSQLSGGQQQRIALARAIVFEPEVLLMDEPLSALDANMRQEMRVEIKKIQREIGITAIFVTHDQEEALSMSDRIVVMNAGTIEQIGTPQQIYEEPNSRFVASFLGNANILDGKVAGLENGVATIVLTGGRTVRTAAPRSLSVGMPVMIVVRQQRMIVSPQGDAAANGMDGSIVSVSYLGGNVVYEVDIGGVTIRCNSTVVGASMTEGDRVRVGFQTTDNVVLDAQGQRLM